MKNRKKNFTRHSPCLTHTFFSPGSATVIALGVGAVWYFASMTLELDVFEYLYALLEQVEHLEADELIIPILFILAGLTFDSYKTYINRVNAEQLAHTKLHTLQLTMRTVQDIVGNFLNNLLLFRLEAENTGALSEKALQNLESLIHETSRKLNKLADVTVVVEKKIGNFASVVDYDTDSH